MLSEDAHVLEKYESVTFNPRATEIQTPSTAAEKLEINDSPLQSEYFPFEEAQTMPNSACKPTPSRKQATKIICKQKKMQFDFKKLFKNPRLLTAAAKAEPPAA